MFEANADLIEARFIYYEDLIAGKLRNLAEHIHKEKADTANSYRTGPLFVCLVVIPASNISR